MRPVKILIACGGSGGHIFPGIALAEALAELNKNCGIFIVTSDRHIDTQIFEEFQFAYSVLPYNPLPESLNPLKIFRFLLNLTEAVIRSISMLKKYKPDCVVGLGGYVSGPLVFGAWLMHKRILVHEQNVLPSLTTRLSAVFADKVCLTFEATGSFFKRIRTARTGNPIRYRFLTENSGSAHEFLKSEPNKFTILVMGGSQGSRVLNDSFKEAMSRMDGGRRAKLRVVHIAGEKDASRIREDYGNMNLEAKVYPFLGRIGPAYRAADLIISRAGATALSEISAFGKPSILIPYPKKRVHQKENAEFFSDRGASVCIEEKNLGADYLKKLILNLMDDSHKLNEMSKRAKILSEPDAAHKLAQETLDLIRDRC